LLKGATPVPLATISKLDAARAQLDAAIELFFTSDNVVAIHTLTAAAYNVLRDLARHQGLEFPFIKSGLMESIEPHQRAAVHRYIHAAENFFKHADHDPSEVLELNPELTELLLVDACSYFRQVDASAPRNADAMKVWCGNLREGIEPDSPLGQFTVAAVAAFRASGKQQFWHWYQQILDGKRVQANAL
jgi:hypothetical protein